MEGLEDALRLGVDDLSTGNCEGSFTRLIVLIRDADFLPIGRGLLLGDGLTTVVFAEELSEVDLLLSWSISVSFEKSSCLPSAPTTAETRTAGARAAVPGSCQDRVLERSEWDRACPCPTCRCLIA